MNSLETLLFVVVDVVLIYLSYKSWHNQKEEEHFGYSKELHEAVEEIAYLDKQIAAVEEIIVDIEASSENAIKYVYVSRPTVAGRELQIDFYVDGESEVTEQFLRLMFCRKDELMERLQEQIALLPSPDRVRIKRLLRRRKNERETSYNRQDKTKGNEM